MKNLTPVTPVTVAVIITHPHKSSIRHPHPYLEGDCETILRRVLALEAHSAVSELALQKECGAGRSVRGTAVPVKAGQAWHTRHLCCTERPRMCTSASGVTKTTGGEGPLGHHASTHVALFRIIG